VKLETTTAVVIENITVNDTISMTGELLSITTAVVVTNSPVIDIVSFTVILSITTAVS
jgi:hypothetical protein